MTRGVHEKLNEFKWEHLNTLAVYPLRTVERENKNLVVQYFLCSKLFILNDW